MAQSEEGGGLGWLFTVVVDDMTTSSCICVIRKLKRNYYYTYTKGEDNAVDVCRRCPELVLRLI